MRCEKCGKTIDNNSKFCEFCGEKITKKISLQTPSPEAVFREEEASAENPEARHEIFIGFVWVVIGVVITWGSYSLASDGGTYFVFWGLIVYGVYKIIKGAYHLFS